MDNGYVVELDYYEVSKVAGLIVETVACMLLYYT